MFIYVAYAFTLFNILHIEDFIYRYIFFINIVLNVVYVSHGSNKYIYMLISYRYWAFYWIIFV